MTIDVREIAVPATWDEDSDTGRIFRELVDVRNAVIRAAWDGDAQHDISHREAHGTASNQDDERRVYLGAWLDGRLVARGYVELSRAEALHVASVDVLVLPDARRRGVGTALWRAAERIVADDGRTTVQAWVDHRPGDGPSITPPTGFGEVPADNAEVAFLRGLGFELQQIERMSALDIRGMAESWSALLDDATEHASDYELLTWVGPAPDEHAAGLAALHARMSIDAPAGGMDIDAERWDVDRLRRLEATEADRGRTILSAVARHVGTGQLAAFTTLVVADDTSRPVYQHDTLVHAEHRGHRLGMLVKVANLQQLQRELPGRSTVITWNAEENRPMLRVNEAIGFRAIGYEGAWQLVR